MFGYIVVNQPEMKFKEYDIYHRYYCGLCKALQEHKGVLGQLSLSYDMTFLVLLLTGLYEPEEQEGHRRCAPHPVVKHVYTQNIFSEYAAAMNMILTYFKCLDDWQDEKKITRKIYSSLLAGGRKRPEDAGEVRYIKKAEIIREKLSELTRLEQEDSRDLDRLSGLFGEIMAEIFAVYEDEWEYSLRKTGYFLGRYVYILDAYDDIEEDIRKKQFNPLIYRLLSFSGENRESNLKVEDISRETWCQFQEWTKEVLMLQASECAMEYEKLPILKNVEILRNILYSGIWVSFYRTSEKRLEK